MRPLYGDAKDIQRRAEEHEARVLAAGEVKAADLGEPWCNSCESYHPVPLNADHKDALMCVADNFGNENPELSTAPSGLERQEQGLAWKDKPTEDGWYWYRHNPEKYPDLPPELAAPLMLMVYDNAKRVQDTVNDLFGREITSSMDGLWAGPLVPPTPNAPEPTSDAFHRGVNAAKNAIRSEADTEDARYFAAVFINAIARKCGSDTKPDSEDEFRRWQDAIRDRVIEKSGAPDSSIDGAGCDSGDPLDLTLAEIDQGFNFIDDQFYDAINAAHPELSWAEGKTAIQIALELIAKPDSEDVEAAELNAERLLTSVMLALDGLRDRCGIAALQWFQHEYQEAVAQMQDADENIVFKARDGLPTPTGKRLPLGKKGINEQ